MRNPGASQALPRSTHGQLTYPDLARIVGTGLLSTGVGLLVFVLITVTYGDPFSALAERGEQRELEQEFAVLEPSTTEPPARASLDPALTRSAATRARTTIPLGSPAGRLQIPRINLNKIVVHGARDDTDDLKKGPGFYQGFPLPGNGAPLAIAGHRTTYGAPFLDLDKIRKRDKIIVTMPYGSFVYTVTDTRIIARDDWTILDYGAAEPTPQGRNAVRSTRRCNGTCEHVVLTACHPKYSAAKRIAVFARLTTAAPAARR